MKKIIFLFLFALMCVTGYSQFTFGVKGGLNMSTFTGNAVEDSKFRPSFHIGGFANFLISEKISIQPELLYSDKGAKSDIHSTYKLGYVELPVLIQYNDASGFFAEAGAQTGLLASSERKSEFNSADFSWVGGLGYKMANGFGIGARYDFGYYNVHKSGIIRNKAIMISVLYSFGAAEAGY